ncbi:MAG: hypothetical protein ACLRIS_08810 [Flavonifractor plautii]
MTVEELYGQMVDTFQRETGLALAGDGDMAVRLYAVAAQLYALYVQADWVGRQCFPRRPRGTTWISMLNCGGWSAGRPQRRSGCSPSRQTIRRRPI